MSLTLWQSGSHNPQWQAVKKKKGNSKPYTEVETLGGSRNHTFFSYCWITLVQLYNKDLQ